MGHIKAMTGGKSPDLQGMPSAPSGSGAETTSLVDVSINSSGGRVQMNLEKKLIGKLGVNGNAKGEMDGIGDEAFVIGNNLLLVRKGDMFIQIAYTNCPCSAAQLEPLAKKLVDQL
jgi:hypothetical protein